MPLHSVLLLSMLPAAMPDVSDEPRSLQGSWVIHNMKLSEERQDILRIRVGHVVAIGTSYVSVYTKESMRRPIGRRYPFASIMWDFDLADGSFRFVGAEVMTIKRAVYCEGKFTITDDGDNLRFTFGDEFIELVRVKRWWE